MGDDQLLNTRFWAEASPKSVLDRLAAGESIAGTDHAGKTPLHLAAAESTCAEVITILLDAGAQVDARDNQKRTPLHWAAAVGEVSVVKILLDRGSDMEARTIEGETPLHRAATHRGTGDSIAVLLDNGANIEGEDDGGRRPLHTAAEFNNRDTEVIRVLLENGADASATTADGFTAYEIAEKHDAAADVLRLLNP